MVVATSLSPLRWMGWRSNSISSEIILHLTLQDDLISMSMMKNLISMTLGNITSSKFDRIAEGKEITDHNLP